MLLYVHIKIFFCLFKDLTSASWNVFIFSNVFDRPLTYLDLGCLIISPSPPSPSTFFSSFFRLSAPAHLEWERSSAVFTLKCSKSNWWCHSFMTWKIKVIKSAWYWSKISRYSMLRINSETNFYVKSLKIQKYVYISKKSSTHSFSSKYSLIFSSLVSNGWLPIPGASKTLRD